MFPPIILAATPSRQADPEAAIAIVFILIVIFVIFGWIVPAIWIYRDASARRTDAGVWLIIGLLAPIIAPIIWFMIRDDPQPKRTPPQIYYYPPPPPPPQYYQQPYYPPTQYAPPQPPAGQPIEVVEVDTEEGYERSYYTNR
jgi:hypothetical protein